MNATGENDVVYLNNGGMLGAPMFIASPLVYAGAAAQRGGTANLVDFDNDGNLDACLVGYGDAGGSHTLLLINPETSDTFKRPVAISAGTVIRTTSPCLIYKLYFKALAEV